MFTRIRCLIGISLLLCGVSLSLLPVGARANGGPGGGGGNGGGGGGNAGSTLASQLRDTWQAQLTSTLLVRLTLNSNGSFTLTETMTDTGQVTVVQGNWTLGPPTVLQPFSNPQGFLTLTSRGQVVLSGNVLLIKADLFEMLPTTDSLTGFVSLIVFAKAAP
jgi:hypothetical protein